MLKSRSWGAYLTAVIDSNKHGAAVQHIFIWQVGLVCQACVCLSKVCWADPVPHNLRQNWHTTKNCFLTLLPKHPIALGIWSSNSCLVLFSYPKTLLWGLIQHHIRRSKGGNPFKRLFSYVDSDRFTNLDEVQYTPTYCTGCCHIMMTACTMVEKCPVRPWEPSLNMML